MDAKEPRTEGGVRGQFVTAEVVEIFLDGDGKQRVRRVRRPCRVEAIPRERFLAADIPVFEDQVRLCPVAGAGGA